MLRMSEPWREQKAENWFCLGVSLRVCAFACMRVRARVLCMRVNALRLCACMPVAFVCVRVYMCASVCLHV